MVARRRAQPVDTDVPEVIELTEEESRALIEREVREVFNMSPDEFVQKWHAGEIPFEDRSDVIGVLMLLRLVG